MVSFKEIEMLAERAGLLEAKESGADDSSDQKPGLRFQSAAEIAAYNAELTARKAQALQKGEVAQNQAGAEISKANAIAETERLHADQIVKQEIQKKRIEIAAEAEAQKLRREARGEADAILARYEAEAKGIRQVLESKAAGYGLLVGSAGGDPRAAATLLMIEKLEDIVEKQVEAVKNLKIDKITVWDSGGANGNGSATSGFISNLIKSLPPLHEIAGMAGVRSW